MATTSAWNNLKKQGQNILNMVNTALPNNPINKLEKTYNALKRDTAPTIQKATQVLNEFNGNGGEQNTGSKLIGFNDPATILKTGGQVAKKTPQVDNTVYAKIQNKVDNLPKSSDSKQTWQSKVKIANLRNADQEQILNAFQKAMYDTNGGLTEDYVNQVIQENKINESYPKFNAKDIIALQFDITPTLRQTGEYVDNRQIAQVYPNLYDYTDSSKIQQKFAEQDEKLQRMMDNVNKANYNALSDNGKIYYNLIQSYADLPNQVRQQYNVSPTVTDSEIISTLAQQDQYTQDLMERIKNKENKLTVQDKKQLFNNTGVAGYLKYLQDLFTGGFTNGAIFNTQVSQTLGKLNNAWQENVQPRIDKGGVRDENGELLAGQGAVSNILSMPGMLLKGAERVVSNGLQLTDFDPNKSVGKQVSEKLENAVKMVGGTIETAFNSVLAPITAGFHVASDVPVMGDIVDWGMEIIPSVVDTVLSGRWRQQVSDATGGQGWLEGESIISDWYNNELDDQGRADLQNSIFVWLLHKYNGSKAKLKVDNFAKSLWNATKESISAGKQGYDLETFYRKQAKGGDVYEERPALPGDEANGNTRVGSATVKTGFREGKLDVTDKFNALGEGVKAGLGKFAEEIRNPDSKTNLGYETLNNITDMEGEKTKVTQGTKKETDDLENEIKKTVNIDEQLKNLNKKINDEIRLSKGENPETKKTLVEIAKDKLTGLDEGTLGRIKNNPVAREMTGRLISDLEENPDLDINEYQTNYLEDTAKTISDKIDQHLDKLYNQIGSLYDAVESNNKPVDNAGLLAEIKDAIKDKVRFDENGDAIFSNRINGSERNTILQLLKDVSDIDDIKKLIEAKRYADDNIPYGQSLSEGEKIIWQIRDKINDLAREQSPEYKKVDDMYSDEIKILNEFKDGITTRKDGKIVLRDNIVSVLKNLLSPANRGKLIRIEKHIPRIRDFVEAVQLLKPAYNALRTGYQSRFVGGIAKGTGGMLLRMAGLTMGGLSGYLAGTLADIGISEAMQGLAKKALKSVLEKESPRARKRTEEIVKKIMDGKKLTEQEQEYIKKLEQEIYEEAEKTKKTKAEKEAWENFKKGVDKDANTPKLEKKDNVKNDDRTIVTGSDKTIVSDGKGKNNEKRQGKLDETDERTEQNKKTGYMTKEQEVNYKRQTNLDEYEKKVSASNKAIGDKTLGDKELSRYADEVQTLAEKINNGDKAGINTENAKKTLAEAEKILDRHGYIVSDLKSGDIYSKDRGNEYGDSAKGYDIVGTAEGKESSTAIVDRVRKPAIYDKNGGVFKKGTVDIDYKEQPQKTAITGTKTAVIEKGQTPQQKAQNIVQGGTNKQVPANPKTKNGKKVVVDTEGKPAKFYHGTPNGGFDSFDMDKRGTSNDLYSLGDYGKGFYFTPNKDTATNYATKNNNVDTKNPEVYEVNLYMDNPLDMRIYHKVERAIMDLSKTVMTRKSTVGKPFHERWLPEDKAKLQAIYKENGFTEEEYDELRSDVESLADNWGDWDFSNKYDGVINPEGDEWIVFDKDQIEILNHTPQQKEEKTAVTGTKTAVTTPKKVSTKGLTNVQKFRLETAKYEPNYESIEADARDLAQDILRDTGADGDVEIVDLVYTGSKARGLEHDTSDDDILIELKPKKGKKVKEDHLFNLLNDEELNGGAYDFNPILADETGTLEDEVVRQEVYMKNKRLIKDQLEKLGVKRDKETADDVALLDNGYYYPEKGFSYLLDEFLRKTDGPIDIWSTEGKNPSGRITAHLIGNGEDQVFTVGHDGPFSDAQMRIVKKIADARKNQKIEIGEIQGDEEDGLEEETTTETPKAENVVTATKTAVTTPKATTKTKKGKSAKEQLEAIVNKWKDVKMDDFSDEDSEGGGRNSKKFLTFSKELKKAFMSVADENNMEVENYSVGYYSVSSFFKDKDSGQYYYVRVEDERDPEWRKGILFRTAKHNKDYTGGSNQFVDLVDLGDKLGKEKRRNAPKEESKKEELKSEGTQGIKPQIEQGEIKGEMYHVTPEDFEEFKEGDTYNDSDWNTAFGTFVTDSKPFLEEFKKTAMQRRRVNSPRKTKTLNVDLKKAVLHPYDVGGDFGADVEDSLIIDYLQLVGRWDIDTIKDVISFKLNDYAYSTQNTDNAFERDYDTYDWKDSYTKEEVLALPGSISGGIAIAQFEGDEVMLFSEDAEQDAKVLKDKGYDGVVFYEGQIDGKPVYSYALFYPNRYLPAEKEETKGNAFGLVQQKGSSRIKNFTNVVKQIIDKYEDKIETYDSGNKQSIMIEKGKGYFPLEIIHDKEKNQLIVRHIAYGYDDPAFLFQINPDGSLKTLGAKLRFMEQMMHNFDWSKTDDRDELLHTRAVNLEDQYLGKNTIDEDTGEMKEPETASEVTNTKNAVTQVKAPESKTKVTEWKDKYLANRTKELADYKGLLSFNKGEYEYTYSHEPFTSKGVVIATMHTQMPLTIEEGDALLEELLERAIMDGDMDLVIGGITYEHHINHSNYDGIDIWEDEDGNRSVTVYRLAKHGDEREIAGGYDLKLFLDEYGEQIQQAQPIDNTQKNTITASDRTALTSNNTENGRNQTSSGKEYEGQGELSNTSKTILTNDGREKVTTNTGTISSSTSTMNASSDSASKSGNGSRAGGSNELIWEKGNDIITSKTVTQARDINRECVSILEKHNYSTNPKDYTENEINTLKQYEGRGGVNDKEDSQTQGALNQYYTKDNIIKAMWRLADPYISKNREVNILEPSLGVGRFFMYAPDNAKLYGFEYDKIPGTIAQILYPDADIKIMDFQDNFMVGKYSVGENYKGRKYDVIIGNPPYQERQGKQRGLGEEPKINRFDDYFIKRGIDMLEDNGILIFVTSSQFLRSGDNYAKQKISEKAQLIDAYRVPIGAFDRTGVETDIIMFQKSGAGDPKLLSASNWFMENPLKILGEEKDVEGRFGTKKGVVGDISVIDNIASAKVVNTTDGNPATLETTFTPKDEVKKEEPVTAKTIEAKKENKPKKKIDAEWQDWTETRLNDAGEQETVTWGKSINGVIFKGKGGNTGTLTVGKGGIGKYQKVLNANGKIGDPDITLDSDREGLNYINGELEPNILYASGHIPSKLEQLEKDYKGGFIDEQQYNKQKDLLEKAKQEEIEYQNLYFSPYVDWILDFETNDITTVRTRDGMKDVKSSIRSVFQRYINERIQSYQIINYKNSKGETETANAGNVMLDILNKGTQFPKSAKEKVATIFPNEFNSFMKGYTLDSDTKSRLQKEFNSLYNAYRNFDYSELGLTVEDISETFRGNIFNLSDVQARGIARILTTESMIIAHGVGQGKTIEGIIGAIASMQQGKARKAIIIIPAGTKSGWMQTVAQLFPNQEMVDLGSLAKGTGVRKKLVDMFGPDPRDWIQDGQLVFLEHSAVGRQISFKNDTLTQLEQGLTDVMESNFEIEKSISEAKKNYEKQEASLEKAREKGASASDIEKKKNKMDELLAEIQKMGSKTENPLQDIIDAYSNKGANEDIITEAVTKIDEDYDTYLHDLQEFIDNQINVGGAKLNRDEALSVVNDIFANERAIYMEDLGIDHMTVDEAHNFRNLFNKSIQDDEDGGSYHAGTNIKEGSKQAKNLYAMAQYIMSKNGGGNVILLTATPFINDPSEMYNMLSYVGKNGLVEMGVENIDSFYDNFVGLENRVSPTASTSGVEYKNVMVGFNNTETLVKNLLDRYIDYEGESLNIVKPRLVTNVLRLTMSELQKEIQGLLEAQVDEGVYYDSWRGVPLGKDRKVNDQGKEMGAVLDGMQQANLNLISPYLTKYLKSQLESLTWKDLIESSPKLKMVIEIIKLQREMGIFRGTFVFMEQGKELHEKLKEAIEESIPGIKVGIINGDKKYSDLTEAQAKKLGVGAKGAKARLTAKQFHDGEIDVLIGGANTKEGIELQGNGYHLIEVSQPRNMNDRIQLNGRMWRQGNLSNEVLDTLLLMNDSSDIYRFELMARKEARWNILEMLSAYKRGERIEDVRVDGQLDMNEEKMALFTDPKKKAKVSIIMEESSLKEQQAQINGQKASIEKLINIIANWGNDYGRYRKIGEGVGNMSKIYDSNNKAVTTNILDDNALEPLEQQLNYARDEAMKKIIELKQRWNEDWTKADMEKRIRNNDPYQYEASVWGDINNKLKQAKGERNLVLRQTDALGIKTLNELEDYLRKLEEQSVEISKQIDEIQSTYDEKVKYFEEQQALNKQYEMDNKSILEDLSEDFKHQHTFSNKEELKNWKEITKDLPKRQQARTKTAITEGKNKYTWDSKEYVGKQATFNKPKNIITSNYRGYTEDYKKPEIKYVGYIPKEVVKTYDGATLTKIGFQDQFLSMNDKLRSIKNKYIQGEEKKSYWRRGDVSDMLARDEYYQSLKKRLSNMILKFAMRFDDEIIKAFIKDNPGKTNVTAEDFYNYINDYKVEEKSEGKYVYKVEDEYVKAGAEYLANKFNGEGNNSDSKTRLTNNGRNNLTSQN